MSQYNDTGYTTITLTETLAQYQRVMVDGSLASATEQDIGVVMQAGVSGDVVSVALISKAGTHKAIAAGAIAAGAKVYGAADGEVNDVQATNSFLRGIAMEAATADQDIIEIMPCIGDTLGA